MKTKAIIQRALPHSSVYTFISASYVPLMDGIGCTCENCGKLIANLVTVENESGKRFVIGSDCADTLTSLKSDVKWVLTGQYAFNEGRQLRAKIQKNLKENKISGVHIYTCTEGNKFIVFDIIKGGTSMQRINYPDITLKFISSFLS